MAAHNGNTLSQKQIAEFYEAFYIIDKDSDGYITMEELALTIQSLGEKRPTDEEVLDMMSEVEGGENGTIGFPDFLNIMARKMEETASDELREAFRVFDRNQDGYISATELRHVMSKMKKKLTLEEAEQMIREADLDGDGQLNFEEFAKMMSLY